MKAMIWYTQLLLFIIWIRICIYGRLLHNHKKIRMEHTLTHTVIVSTAMKYSNKNNRYYVDNNDDDDDNKFNGTCTHTQAHTFDYL